MRPHEHKLSIKPKVYIVTVSTSRYKMMIEGRCLTDESGDYAESLLRREGITDIKRILVKDDIKMIREVVAEATKRGVNLMIFIGGTGVSPDDQTIEALKPMLSKELPGFQILFTLYSADEVGSRAISSRALAGFIKNTLVFSIPGSLNAVKTALEKLIIPEYEHLLYISEILR